MQLVLPLVYLALWTSSTTAFYPYTPAWLKDIEETVSLGEARRAVEADSSDARTLAIKQIAGRPVASHSRQAAREAARLAQKYARKKPVSDSLTRRENEYKVIEAVPPTGTMAAGISQDGTDYSYFVQVAFGSKGTPLYLLVDTGAGSSWVMGTSCDTEACGMHDTFGADLSDTFKSSDEDFSVAYGSGKVKGKLATDTVALAGMSFKYKFGVAATTSNEFESFAFDGILGLSMGKGASDNFLATLDEANPIDNNIFSVSLNRGADGTNDGEIQFGATNPDKYTGDINYSPLKSDGGDWSINLDDISFDGTKAGVGGRAFIDTGTTYIFGPPKTVKKMHDTIPGAETSDGTYFSVPCDSTTPLVFTFSGVDYEISPKDWISPQDSNGKCTSNIYGQEVVESSWLLGATFLKNVYAVFDRDRKQIGFAAASDSSSSSPSPSPSSKPTSSKPASSSAGKSSTPPTSDASSSSNAGDSSDTNGATTFSTEVASTTTKPDASKPDLGLTGHETKIATGSAAEETDKASETDDPDSAAAGLHPRSVVGLIACAFASVALL